MSDLKYLTDEERELTRCVCDPRHACDDCRPTRTLAIRLNEARAERIQYREKLLERLGLKDGDGVSVLAAVRELAELKKENITDVVTQTISLPDGDHISSYPATNATLPF